MGCGSSIPVVLDPLLFKEECSHDDFSEELVTLSNGSKRNITKWIPKSNTIKGIVLFCHGLYEHALVFDKLAHEFTKKNYACFGIDHYAHGLSEGTKGLITDYHFLVNDFVAFAAYIRSKPENWSGDLPTFIVCHSMGTLVTTLSLNQIPNITSVVFIGTAFFAGHAASRPFGIKFLYPLSKTSAAKGMLSITSALDPKGPAGPIILSEMCNDPDSLDKRCHCGRSYLGQIMNKTAYEYLKMSTAAQAEVPKLKTPFLVMHGKDDLIALPTGSEFLYYNSGTIWTKKTLLLLDNVKHHPIHEPKDVATDAMDKIVTFVEGSLIKNDQ